MVLGSWSIWVLFTGTEDSFPQVEVEADTVLGQLVNPLPEGRGPTPQLPPPRPGLGLGKLPALCPFPCPGSSYGKPTCREG